MHHVLRGYVISMRRTFGEKNLQCARRYLGVVLFVLGCLFGERDLIAEEKKGITEGQESKENVASSTTKNESASSSKGSTASGTQNSFEKVVKDTQRIEGLLPLYQSEEKLFVEVPNKLLGKEFFVTISIAQGIGSRSLLGGMSWGDGDDWVWTFRKRADKLQIVRKNVRFFAKSGSPEADAVANAFTDSILFSVPILAKTTTVV